MPKCSTKDIQRAAKWNRENPERRKEILKRNYEKYHQKYSDFQRFGRCRKEIFERDKYICQKCNGLFSENRLVVHHKDGKGRNCKEKNNSLENLETLCRSCHITIHHKGIKNPKKAPTKETHPSLWQPLNQTTKEKIRSSLRRLYENGYVSPNKGRKTKKEKACLICKKVLFLKAKGLCLNCYTRKWYHEARNKKLQNAFWVQ